MIGRHTKTKTSLLEQRARHSNGSKRVQLEKSFLPQNASAKGLSSHTVLQSTRVCQIKNFSHRIVAGGTFLLHLISHWACIMVLVFPLVQILWASPGHHSAPNQSTLPFHIHGLLLYEALSMLGRLIDTSYHSQDGTYEPLQPQKNVAIPSICGESPDVGRCK
jgi:hypothetical protein